jgi:hypothetical protein
MIALHTRMTASTWRLLRILDDVIFSNSSLPSNVPYENSSCVLRDGTGGLICPDEIRP